MHIRTQNDVSATAAITAIGSTPRNKFFAAKLTQPRPPLPPWANTLIRSTNMEAPYPDSFRTAVIPRLAKRAEGPHKRGWITHVEA